MLQSELRRRLTSFEAYYEDVPAPEVVLSLIPAEVRGMGAGTADSGCRAVGHR
jgi:hypothetical protein